jgi:hypothetical protein
VKKEHVAHRKEGGQHGVDQILPQGCHAKRHSALPSEMISSSLFIKYIISLHECSGLVNKSVNHLFIKVFIFGD